MARSGRTSSAPPTTSSSDPNMVPQTKLASTIGWSVITINKWRSKFDDFPGPHPQTGRYNVPKVQAWISEHEDEIGAVSGSKGKVGAKREDLMCENLEKRNILLDRQIGEAEHRLIDGDKVIAAITKERTVLLESFRKRIVSEIPAEAEGKRAKAIATLLDDAFDEFLEDVQKSIPRILKAATV